MYKTPIYHDPFGNQFDAWAEATLIGTWEITLGAESYMEFSDQSDAALYLITWYQAHAYSTGADAGAFYCPYVPLTSSGVIVDSESVDSVTTFITRYSYMK